MRLSNVMLALCNVICVCVCVCVCIYIANGTLQVPPKAKWKMYSNYLNHVIITHFTCGPPHLPKWLAMVRNSGATPLPPRSPLYVKWVDIICNSGKQILFVTRYISS
jgi:hypothetical protein